VRALVVSAMAACAPQTDLWAGATDRSSATSSALVLASPAAGESSVPLNLQALLVRLPSDLELPPPDSAAVQVMGGPVPLGTRSREAVACDGAGTALCWPLVLDGPLLASTRYDAALVSSLPLRGGGAVAPAIIGQFSTASAPDERPPVVSVGAVELAGPCLHVTLTVDEPASIFLLLAPVSADVVRGEGAGGAVGAAGGRGWPAGQGMGDFEAWVPSSGFSGVVSLQAQAVDRAGNVGAAAAVSVTLPDLPALKITEILSNPAGPEPAQEFVELANVGPGEIELDGLWLEDSKGHDRLPATSLAPGAFALVVPAAFDAAAPGDVAVRTGTLLARVDSRLGGDGLANDRDVVRLRLPDDGAIISSYDGAISTASAAWNGRSLHRRAGSICDNATSWSAAPLAPTPGWE